jgi:hypothetical protein
MAPCTLSGRRSIACADRWARTWIRRRIVSGTVTSADEIGAYAADETIHHYHRAAAELWKFCFERGGGAHAEFIADLLDRMTADAETVDWWERAAPRRHQ